ncbi:hypothetical protein VNI00_017333 [Paramarasmius palmivorus]|uniref:Uncharacterized protein n=1 Tax=Paramarasmius palmivorus TaxID=297713 RepID=A0AAW0B675_9AGAR
MTWEPPIGTTKNPANSSEESAVDAAFRSLEKELEKELSVEGVDTEDNGFLVTSGDVFNFDEIRHALEGIAPAPYADEIEVVREGSGGSWSISDIVGN